MKWKKEHHTISTTKYTQQDYKLNYNYSPALVSLYSTLRQLYKVIRVWSPLNMPPKETRISTRITTETWCSHPGGWCLTHQSLQITGQLLKENHDDIIMCEYALVLYNYIPSASEGIHADKSASLLNRWCWMKKETRWPLLSVAFWTQYNKGFEVDIG